jgi:hypothetical protein
MDQLEQLKQYREQGLKDCPLCVCWFLGCLNGRKEWKDKSVKPNFRFVGLSGTEYPDSDNPAIPDSEYPCRMFCDAFQWDPSKERLGRAVY